MSDCRIRKKVIIAAALTILIAIVAAAFFFHYGSGTLVIENVKTSQIYKRFRLHEGDTFSVGFVHSVNKTPVTNYYELRKDGIYVVKTVYYSFGAGMQTEIEEGQTLEYGEDGSMIVTGFNKKIDDLIYFVGTVSDHTLVVNEKETISLRDLCGRNAMVRFRWK